jgi:hypothetical protein
MKNQIRKLTPQGNFIKDTLGIDMYLTWAYALMELIKNGFDSWRAMMRRLLEEGKEETCESIIRIYVSRSVLSIIDNGQGIVDDEAFMDRLGKRVKNNQVIKTGETDNKGIGRFSVEKLKKDDSSEAIFYSATEGKKKIDKYLLLPAEGRFEPSEIDRTSDELRGYDLPATFCLVKITNVIDEMRDPEAIKSALAWFLPRRKTHNSFTLYVNDVEVKPPPLPNAEPIEQGEMVGYFEKKDPGDESAEVIICDTATGIPVARASQMAEYLPPSFTLPGLSGVIFVPGIMDQQKSSRDRLKTEFLRSAKWKKIMGAMFFVFNEHLLKLMGEEAHTQDRQLTKSINRVLDLFNRHWGKKISGDEPNLPLPTKKPKSSPIGDGGQPADLGLPDSDGKQPTGTGEQAADSPDKKEQPADAGADNQPPIVAEAQPGDFPDVVSTKKNPTSPVSMTFVYEGKVYSVGLTELDEDVAAQLFEDRKDFIFFNRKHFQLSHNKNSTTGFTQFVAASLIEAIEMENENLGSRIMWRKKVSKSLREMLSDLKRK